MKIECVVPDVCLSDYWGGHHLPHVQVPVYHGMKVKDFKAAIRDEVKQGYVMGSNDDAMLLSAHFLSPDEEQRAVDLTEAIYAAINRIRPARKGAKTLFRDLGKCDDEDTESVYAFVVFVVVE